jgi:hypothetical protein
MRLIGLPCFPLAFTIVAIHREAFDRIDCVWRLLGLYYRIHLIYLLEVGPGDPEDPSICKSIILQ